MAEFAECIFAKDPKDPMTTSNLEPRWFSGHWLGKAERSDEHLIEIEDRVVRVRTIKRKSEEERWNVVMDKRFCSYPWGQKGQVAEDIAQRRQYITVAEVRKHGPTTGCSACTGDEEQHNKRCHERLQNTWAMQGPRVQVAVPAPSVEAKGEKAEAISKKEAAVGQTPKSEKMEISFGTPGACMPSLPEYPAGAAPVQGESLM